MDVAGADGGVDELGELGDAGLGDHGRAAGAVGGDGAVVAGQVGTLKVAQTGGAIAGAGAADREEAHVLGGTGDQLAIEAAAYENREAMVAEGPHAGEHTAVPEGVDGRRADVEADGGTGFADMLVAEGGAQTERDDARQAGNDGEDYSLLQSVGGGHTLSLPLGWADGD